jgi:hypothetical protein
MPNTHPRPQRDKDIKLVACRTRNQHDARKPAAGLLLDDARAKMEAWRRDYNEVRPHSSISHKTPIEMMKRSEGSSPA